MHQAGKVAEFVKAVCNLKLCPVLPPLVLEACDTSSGHRQPLPAAVGMLSSYLVIKHAFEVALRIQYKLALGDFVVVFSTDRMKYKH